MKKRELFLISIALICFAAALAGCTGTQSNPSTTGITAGTPATQADVIHLAGGDYGYPQPFTIYPRGPGSSKVTMIFDSLLEKDEKGLIPWLAESWSVSPDGSEYTFVLRKGVTWQDGTAFTAKDVKFTYDYEVKNLPVSGGIEEGIIDKVQVI
ncbi:MAG: diguanylate phosphodiesterase, partial [Methanomicrobiales archaeon]|nr:diguanylate phosphodiesterase [Methanomicrobiales archaeon]